MNGDGFRELVVGAPLEDDHQGAIYVFYGQGRSVQQQYKQVRGADPGQTVSVSSVSQLPNLSLQRVAAAGFSSTGLQYFGQSLHGVSDVNGDGLVDLAVGALGAAVIIWYDRLHTQPKKTNL